jgi:hypothetical protein
MHSWNGHHSNMAQSQQADWLVHALDTIPELLEQLADDCADADGIYASVVEAVESPFEVWFELLPMTRDSHRREAAPSSASEQAVAHALLGRIYGYAAWSFARPEKELWNAVGVGFYEHLFDEVWMRPLVVPWLSRQVVADVYSLWEYRLDRDAMKEVHKLLWSHGLLQRTKNARRPDPRGRSRR